MRTVLRHGSPFPRRNCLDLYCKAEAAIAAARDAIELAGAHPLLTDALLLVNQAQDKVADWYELDDVWNAAHYGYVLRGSGGLFYVAPGIFDDSSSRWTTDEKLARHFSAREDADRYWEQGCEVVPATVGSEKERPA